MSQAWLGWWRVRTAREQRLLAVMGALLVLVLGWLLVVRPLADALDEAQRRHASAVAALAQARAQADAAGRLHGSAAPAVPLPVNGFVTRTANEAGFAGARVAARGPTAAVIAIPAARAPAFFTWVRLMERRGLEVQSLRARANQDRTLAVEATFRARRG
jgi:general secretion pathway protein M